MKLFRSTLVALFAAILLPALASGQAFNGQIDKAPNLSLSKILGVDSTGRVGLTPMPAGPLVGTTDTQTLTNKTLSNSTLSGPTITGTLNGNSFPSSPLVGTTDTQTLTNKTLSSPTLSGPTITGTLNGNSLPSGPIVGTTDVQTLTNKTLTGPTVSDNIQSPVFTTNVLWGHAGVQGSTWSSQGHPNWNVVQTTRTYNPTEWQIYTNAAQGIVSTTAGGGQVTRVSGTAFDASWVGIPNSFFIEGVAYTVTAVADASHMTVSTTWAATTAVNTYYFVSTTATSVVNVAGTAVTRVSGDDFVPFFNYIKINGVVYTGTFVDTSHLTLATSGGTQTGVSQTTYGNINSELSILRLQGLSGSNEENFAITNRPDGYYLQALYAGQGKYRPIYFSTGENPAGNFNPLVAMYPDATIGNPSKLFLGGSSTSGVLAMTQNSANVNRFVMAGSPTGGGPALEARGTDTNVGMAFDTQGSGIFQFTTGSFGSVALQVNGAASANSNVALTASASGSPIVGVSAIPANANLNLAAKGTGVIAAVSPIQLPAYTVAALPTCSTTIKGSLASVSDFSGTPAYNGALTGGGAVSLPVYCNGTAWTAH